MGADVVLNPAEASPYDKWAELGVAEQPPSPLLGPEIGRPGSVIAFECVGAPGLLQQLIDGTPRHTRIVVVGVGSAPDPITPYTAILEEISVGFVFAYRQAEFAHALALLADARVAAGAFITGTVVLAGVPQAFADLRTPDEHVKILVHPQ